MSDLYLYKNQLWKPVYDFRYTGSPQEFTLNPGKYLFMCHGANGGKPGNRTFINRGGSSYGVMNLEERTKMYAFVGGNGGDSVKELSAFGSGGYNGGGNGGSGSPRGYSPPYYCGAGGGGASDIRLYEDDGTLIEQRVPEEYVQIEYVGTHNNGELYVDTEYLVKPNTRVVCDARIKSSDSKQWSCLFGTNHNGTDPFLFYVFYDSIAKAYFSNGNGSSAVNTNFVYNTKVRIETNSTGVSWSVNGKMVDQIVLSKEQTTSMTTSHLFLFNAASGETNSTANSWCWADIYGFKIYEDDTLIADLVPCYRKSDNVGGLYDTVRNKFFTSATSTTLTKGPRNPGLYNKSLLSRIIVAGGGGGGQNVGEDSYLDFSGYGGGVYGGYPYVSSSTVNNQKESGQTYGYDFGIGQSAPNRVYTDNASWGAEGISGGGGGWYGGYCPQSAVTNIAYSGGNGGGGSGYVYTESSYKPDNFISGYEDRTDLMFSDVFMDAGSAEESAVIICEPTNSYTNGDRIICPCVGEGNKFTLLRGKYTVKCYGGSGAHRTISSYAAKGGYAQGTFENPDVQDAFVYVGGSGLFTPSNKSAAFTQTTFPTLCFNGGGNPSSFSGINAGGEAAGGGTDLRIGTDSLFARIIVAGGAGGTGRSSSRGGTGGGTTGGDQSGASYGDNYGPGKQNSAGSGSIAAISGGFGYGGNGLTQNGGYGGAGGGGWYGGSGTSPDGGSDDDRAGSGGSGYVLTDSSYKPSGYLLDERYYMTDTTLTTGGNDLPKGLTKLIIECNEVFNFKILCYDSEGYKYFDEENMSWVYLKSDELTVDDFETYGSYVFVNDIGLKDEYSVYVYDTMETIDTAAFNVVPPEQIIKTRYYTQHMLSRCAIDADIDTDNVSLKVIPERKGVAENAHIDFSIICNMKDIPNIETRMYCIQGYTQGSSLQYKERKPKEKTIEHIDLLPVGTSNKMPSRFKSYIGGFINGTEAISKINSAVCCERNRCIYSATLCNDKIVRFAKLNLVTNTSSVIKDIPKSQLGNTYYGGILVDDNYIYLTSSENNSKRTLWRIPLNPDDTTINTYTPGNSDDYNFNAYGRMEWWNDHTIIILYRRGIFLFDTKKLSWTFKASPSQNGARRDMIVGKRYVLSIYEGNSDSAYVCEVETNTWKTLPDFGFNWSGSYLNCGCYANGKFYVTQQNRMHIVDEETMTIEKSFPTPYSNIIPKTVNHASGILYITIQNSPSLFIYDIKNDRFYATAMPFTMDNYVANGWIRPTSFRGYFFAPQIRLYTINFSEYAKYNMGYKYDQFIMVTNKENSETQGYEYDDRFVTFTDSNMWIHVGDIVKSLEIVDPENHIKCCQINKKEYNKFISLNLLKASTNNNESEVDANGT